MTEEIQCLKEEQERELLEITNKYEEVPYCSLQFAYCVVFVFVIMVLGGISNSAIV